MPMVALGALHSACEYGEKTGLHVLLFLYALIAYTAGLEGSLSGIHCQLSVPYPTSHTDRFMP